MSVKISKVLICDNIDQKCAGILTHNGIEVVTKQKLAEDDLIRELEDCDGLIVRSETKATKRVIDSANKLKVIGRAGTGVDNISLPDATKKGIIVLNSPTGNSVSACELTCSLITCLARNVAAACQSLKEGRWDRKVYSNGNELLGKTLGIVGLGKIGKEVAVRMNSFGMRVVGYDPFVSPQEALEYSIEKMTLEELWPVADYITVHTPLIPQTKNLINTDVFGKCKSNVKIINVARGGIINEQDLLTALKDGRCGGAALDVFSEEPPTSSFLHELISHPKVIVTPHLGASTAEAQTRVAVEVAEQFSSLNDPHSQYPITGIVNAPALLASLKAENAAWIVATEQLGRVIGRITKDISTSGSKIELSLIGNEIKNKQFLSSSVLVGILSEKNKNGYNLINSALYAKEAGLEVSFANIVPEKRDDDNSILKVSLFNGVLEYSVTGAVFNEKCYLLKVNDASFPPFSVELNENLQLFSCNSPEEIQSVIEKVLNENDEVVNISIAHGKTSWIAFRFKDKAIQ